MFGTPLRGSARGRAGMVVVAQLVEHRVVVPGVAGSSPVDHPIEEQVKAPGRVSGQAL